MTETTPWWVGLLGGLFPLIAGFLAYKVLALLKKLTTIINDTIPTWLTKFIHIDGFPATVQRLLLLGVAAGLTWLGATLGIQLPTDLAMVGQEDVSHILQALFAMLLAMGIHAGDKHKTNGTSPTGSTGGRAGGTDPDEKTY